MAKSTKSEKDGQKWLYGGCKYRRRKRGVEETETQMTRQEEKDNGLTGGTHDKHKGPDY